MIVVSGYHSTVFLGIYHFYQLLLSVTMLVIVFSCSRVRANSNNDKRGTTSGNVMELSSPSQHVSDESPYVIHDTNGPYGNYTIIFIISYINTKWKLVRATMGVASLHDFRLTQYFYQRRV